jgi:glycosyltransferase involved in cell wall biosynthesis
MDHVELESSLPSVSPLRRYLQRYLEQRSIRRYDGTVVASKYLESLFERSHRGKLLYLPFGADPFTDEEVKASERWHQANGESPYLLFAGGIYKNYGIWTMIDAIRLAVKQEPNITLSIAGRGPEKVCAEEAIREHGLTRNVKILGYVSAENLNNLILNASE